MLACEELTTSLSNLTACPQNFESTNIEEKGPGFQYMLMLVFLLLNS
jgi:hypothetical protein